MDKKERTSAEIIMEEKIRTLIKELKRQGLTGALGEAGADEKVNVWWVTAKLQEILLEQR